MLRLMIKWKNTNKEKDMIKHIVMWTLKDEHNGKNKPEIAEELKSHLLSLKSKISELKSIEVGFNAIHQDKNHDVAIVTEFESFDGLAIYAQHPEHLKVGEYLKGIATGRAAIDFTLE
jgi:phenylalanyl-tRNA synthetase alpha subunit